MRFYAHNKLELHMHIYIYTYHWYINTSIYKIYIYIHIFIYLQIWDYKPGFHVCSDPGLHRLSSHSFCFGSSKQQLGHPRTIPDPEFPGEDEHLFFVMVELNLDDVKELKRVTALEMQGTLDAEGVKAFVEALQLNVAYIYSIGFQTFHLGMPNLFHSVPNTHMVSNMCSKRFQI
jgi:hypothetical protein